MHPPGVPQVVKWWSDPGSFTPRVLSNTHPPGFLWVLLQWGSFFPRPAPFRALPTRLATLSLGPPFSHVFYHTDIPCHVYFSWIGFQGWPTSGLCQPSPEVLLTNSGSSLLHFAFWIYILLFLLAKTYPF